MKSAFFIGYMYIHLNYIVSWNEYFVKFQLKANHCVPTKNDFQRRRPVSLFFYIVSNFVFYHLEMW